MARKRKQRTRIAVFFRALLWLLALGGLCAGVGRGLLFLEVVGGVCGLVLLLRLLRWYLRWLRLRALRIADVDRMPGSEFEEYLARLLRHQGYQVERLGGSGDLGVDLIARRRSEACAVQAKRSSRPVSRRAVSDAVAGAQHYGCTRAMVVTNNLFTPGAEALAESTACALVDREALMEWIYRFRGTPERMDDSPHNAR
jgi:restriction system protein